MLEGNFVTIYYNDNIICQGKVINSKHTHPKVANIGLVSVDNTYYFNLRCQGVRLEMENNNPFRETILNLDGLKVVEWQDFAEYPNLIVFREHNITELDPEVEDLVNAINGMYDVYTTGSCSGHETSPLWVSIACRNFEGAIKLTSFFNDNTLFNKDWELKTHSLLYAPKDIVHLRLESKYKGKLAYENAQKLALYLETKGDFVYG